MNDEMIELLGYIQVFDIFAEFGEVTSLKDIPRLENEYIKQDNFQLSEFFREWRKVLEYYIDREHNIEDEREYVI